MQDGTIRYENDADGRVWILLETGRPRHDTDQDATEHRHDSEASPELVEELRDRLRFVERQLEAERQAHAEARRIIGGLVQRIPELEAPQEALTDAPGAPTEATEQPGRESRRRRSRGRRRP